jgi:translation initiation factor 4B
LSIINIDTESDQRTPRPLLPLPTQPPYTAHIGNLSFDVTDSEIERYFEDCKVSNVRIMKDRIDNRPKGFGYVEFADLDSLKTALSRSDGQLAGRSIRVSVAEPRKIVL